ncbi:MULTISPECIES: hypothetical protein [unclassified Mesotoga]|jgi:hypothetical protein|uniref:Uncharacterized protein n=1 Tax=Mesotoga infera TaxID=1236046 RepID=A0A101I6R1_9BACT|nr:MULTISPECIES: hypothetical protein [unclassified Mesotoga]KUK67124.1 MAG: Uncharacterized protein XD86_0890 [Mesotoga infera]KUK89690.1 MAG: Uncharacterized protein XE02_0897 [Mesotoga infera]PZC53146.1 hypothetical protein LH53_00215 [Mesotoga sp. TolDC]HCO69259.1 hypothetical protein [Mesotoga infera]
MLLTSQEKRYSNKTEMTLDDLIQKLNDLGLYSLKKVVVSEIEGTETRLVTENRVIDPNDLEEILRSWEDESIRKVMLLDMTPVHRHHNTFPSAARNIYEPPEFSIQVTRVSNGVETIVVAVKSVDPR